MARLTDKQRKKIIADYLELQSVNATAKRNGVSWKTANIVINQDEELNRKLEEKKEQNTADIIAYMESRRQVVCEIIEKGLNALNSEEKLAEATPAQITTALGTLIDKFTAINAASVEDVRKDDELSRSLKELAKEMESNED